MGIRTKFNILLALVWLAGVAGLLAVSSMLISGIAKDDVLQTARLMMEGASGARNYTATELAPLLKRDIGTTFHPQIVASYSAKKSFAALHTRYPDYAYSEVALNPTNPDDRALDWQADIINDFRTHPEKKEAVVQRSTPMGEVLDLAKPIVDGPACLICHSTPQAAPATMVDIYGRNNGFGWQPNAVIGAQIVSVPVADAKLRAGQIRGAFIWPFTAVFALLFVLINVVLNIVVIGPVEKMAKVVEAVSAGDMDTPEYVRAGSDQIARLAKAINLMRRSLAQAIKMLGS